MPEQERQTSSMTSDETILLVEGWLRNEPALSFKRVRSDARNLNVSVTARQYSEAKKRLGITAAPPRTAPPRTPRGDVMNGSEAPKTPLMAFTVDFLRGKPEATFQEVKAAGVAAGFQVAPINYGNARRSLGMAAKARVSRGSRRRRLRQADEPAGAPGDIAAIVDSGRRGRRGRKRKLDFSNLNNLVAELQDVVAERDRLLSALDQIAAIIRSV
jgi:hypothetical protein